MDEVCCKRNESNLTDRCINIKRKVSGRFIAAAAIMVIELMTVGRSTSRTSRGTTRRNQYEKWREQPKKRELFTDWCEGPKGTFFSDRLSSK